jgi:hypothetical protein
MSNLLFKARDEKSKTPSKLAKKLKIRGNR